jgi:hypothetical protein
MDELLSTLEAQFEDEGYTVADVTRNRDRIRVVLLEAGAEADQLRTITHEAVPEDEVLGLDVVTESVEGSDGMNTVVTFRHRPS